MYTDVGKLTPNQRVHTCADTHSHPHHTQLQIPTSYVRAMNEHTASALRHGKFISLAY